MQRTQSYAKDPFIPVHLDWDRILLIAAWAWQQDGSEGLNEFLFISLKLSKFNISNPFSKENCILYQTISRSSMKNQKWLIELARFKIS